MIYTCYDSPVGPLLLAGDGETLSLLGFPQGARSRKPETDWTRSDDSFALHRVQLDEYFSGNRLQFDLPLAPRGTDFQRQVWRALCEIPCGQTRSYGQIAAQIKRPGASRAVGAANGANPIPVIIPCHRVIGSNGNLTGFGGGLQTKQWLLAHEQQHKHGSDSRFAQAELQF